MFSFNCLKIFVILWIKHIKECNVIQHRSLIGTDIKNEHLCLIYSILQPFTHIDQQKYEKILQTG